MSTKIIEQQVQKTDLLDLELKSTYGALVIPNSSENFTFELRQSPGVERS